MNRPFIALTVLLSAAVIQAQTPTYIDVEEVSGSGLIRVTRIEDFATLVKEGKVKNVFRTADRFAVQVDSVLYTMESSGFRTIQDYREGKETFGTGDLYYVALAQGLTTRAEVEYWNGELFFTGADYLKARKAGFVESAAAEKPRGVIGLMRAAELQRNIHTVNALLAIKRRIGLREAATDDLFANKEVAYLVKNGDGYILAVTEDLYYLCITTDWLQSPGAGSDSLAGQIRRVFKAGRDEDSDAVFYYLAQLGGYATPADARDSVLAAKVERGMLTIQGTEKMLKAAGFLHVQQIPGALSRGFSDGGEFTLAVEYNLADRAEYLSYEDRIADYEKLRSRYGLKTKSEAAVVRKLLDLPKRVPVSFGRFAEQHNKEAAADPLLKRFDFRIAEGTVATLLARSKDLADQFVYDKEGKSLYRR